MYYVGSVMCDGGAAIYHHGILGMKWGIRRFQNKDGSLTAAGRERYNVGETSEKSRRSGGTDVEARRARTKKYIKRGLAVAGVVAAVGAAYAIGRHPELVKKGAASARKLMGDVANAGRDVYEKGKATVNQFTAGVKGYGMPDRFGTTSAATKLGEGIRSAAKTGGSLYRQGRDAVTGVTADIARRGGDLYRQGRDAITGFATDAAKAGGSLYRQGRDAVTGFATDAARRGGDLYRQGAKAASDFVAGAQGRGPGIGQKVPILGGRGGFYQTAKYGPQYRTTAPLTSAAAAGKALRQFMQGVGSSAKSAQQGVQAFLASAARQGSAAYQNALKAIQDSGLYRSINGRLTQTNYAPNGQYNRLKSRREAFQFGSMYPRVLTDNPGRNLFSSRVWTNLGRSSAGSYSKKQRTYDDMRRLLWQGVEANQGASNSFIPWDQVRRYSPYGAIGTGIGMAGGAATVASRKKKKRST